MNAWSWDSWEDIRRFLAIASAGSLTGAARALGVDHSTLSRQLGAMERRLAVPLFHRSRDGVTLSRAGNALLATARAAEARMLAVERKLGALAAEARSVRLATSGILATGLLAPHVAKLSAPSLELVVSRQLVSLDRGEADLALRLRPPRTYVAEANVIVSVLARVGWAAYATSHDVAERAVIAFSTPVKPGGAWVNGRRSARRILVDDVPTALELARHGAGAAVLPCFLAERDRATLKWRSERLEHHRLIVAVPRELRATEPVASVLRWLRGVAALEKTRLA